MRYIDIHKVKREDKENRESLIFTHEGRSYEVGLSEQKTGYGIRAFFVCPYCEKRRVRLYLLSYGFQCAKCAGYNPYKRIQNGTKGGYLEIEYRMKKYADRNGIAFEIPFNYLAFGLDRRMVRESFRRKIMVLQALENIRFQNIFFNMIYSPKVIRMIIKGEHPLLTRVSLKDMKEGIYDFNMWVR